MVSRDSTVLEKARLLRNYGQSTRYDHIELGLNSRLDEMQAAILCERLPYLEAFTARRHDVAIAYDKGFSHPLVRILAEPEAHEAHVHHLCVVTSPCRDLLAEHLRNAGVETLIHYPIPDRKQPALTDVRTDPIGLPRAEEHARTCLSLPCHPGLTDDEVTKVIEAVNAFKCHD